MKEVFFVEARIVRYYLLPFFHIKAKSQNKRPGRTLYCKVNPPLYCSYQKMREKKLCVGYQFVDFGYQFVGY